jgi:serine/threonine protein kinase
MIGKTIKSYKIYDVIESGGMADIYLARNQKGGEIVAIKVPKKEYLKDSKLIDRFRQEIELHSQVSHGNIVSYLDSGELPEKIPYLVIEYVRGKDLSKLIAEGDLDIVEVVSIIKQVALGLGVIHNQGIIHRDIDPKNIMITHDHQAKLMDFGIARSNQHKHLTPYGQTIGKPHYISCEVAKGQPATVQSDIYSLGIVFFEALTGQVPFDSDTPLVILNMHIKDDPGPPSRHNARVPREVDVIVAKMLAKDVKKRYQNVSDLVNDIQLYHGRREDRKKTVLLSAYDELPLEEKREHDSRRKQKNNNIVLWVCASLGTIFVFALILGGSYFLERPNSIKATTPTGPMNREINGGEVETPAKNGGIPSPPVPVSAPDPPPVVKSVPLSKLPLPAKTVRPSESMATQNSNIEAVIKRAKELHEEGKYEESIEKYNQVLKLYPDNSVAIEGRRRAKLAWDAEERIKNK